jgi:hypothetical protein
MSCCGYFPDEELTKDFIGLVREAIRENYDPRKIKYSTKKK